MQDHEPDFPPIKTVDPASPIQSLPMVPGPGSSLMAPPVPQPSQILSQFQFSHEGKAYLATILNTSQGVSVDLKKAMGSHWAPSYSRLRAGILGAYLYHAAMQSAPTPLPDGPKGG